MTEAEWLVCTDPQTMLGFLHTKASERKFRLFAAACCRRIWNLLTDDRSRKAVEVAERYADDLAPSAELADAYEAARPLVHQMGILNVFAAHAACESSRSDLLIDGATQVQRIAHAVVVAVKRKYHIREAGIVGWSRQAAFLRCIFGPLPFRQAPISPTIRTWNDAVVVRLAQAAYEERRLPAGTLDNTRLLILADALEEAGCTNQDILAHCRSGGEHVRGCWVIDGILGKN